MKKLFSFLIIPLIIFTFGCTEKIKDEKIDQNNMQYNWSTMNEGPYNDIISFATSTDLLNWTDTETILCEHCSVGDAIYKDGEIYFYFVDVSEDGVAEKLGLITSDDNGLTWSEKQFITIEGIGDKAAVDPSPLLEDNGQIRLFYFDIEEERSSGARPGTTGATNKIYSAISDDGLNFTEEEGVRFEYEGIFDPDVIKVGDEYKMYTGDIMGNSVYLATSTNGLDFEYEALVYTEGAIPEVFYTGENYYLFTGGIDISESLDGTRFTKTTNRFESNISMLTADPSVIQLDDESYILFYKTSKMGPEFNNKPSPPSPAL
ncbi:MAG: hypothetical protein ABID45_01105 [Patescibacteria group bacterium]